VKIQIDLDPKDVWRIQETAERRGITPGQVLRDELLSRRHGRELREAIRQRVLAKMCDADIAAELGRTAGYIGEVRRSLGLPANRRYARKKPCVNGHDLDEDNNLYVDPTGRERCRACHREDNRRRRNK
jgi:hypothetical protein